MYNASLLEMPVFLLNQLNQLTTPHLRFSSIPLSVERTIETSQIHSIAITKQKRQRGI